jgi:exopolysaccharide biosynthesis polyprenyl glycosylphosphotransferase
VLFSTQFIFTFLGRFFVLHQSKLILKQKKFGFNTLLIGSPKKVNELLHTLTQKVVKRASTFIFKGWINSSSESPSTVVLPCLGDATQIQTSITKYDIKEVIIAIETSAHQELNYYLNILAGNDVYIRIVPDMYDILSRGVKMNHVVGEAFIEIPPSLLNEWEVISKRWFDILASSFALLVTAPFLFFIALRIKFSSTGPIFYTQERIGQFGKPFHIIKFRSMYVNAEEQGPKLTTDEDPRITPIGKWIRKYRIDEVPQFWNVIKGDMSIVGPRAERQFFAEKIIVAAPHYKLVWKVKPGITSLGMVKYGYASTVEEMLQRLKYDIIYIENMNLLLDLKILLYTISTVIYGRGK